MMTDRTSDESDAADQAYATVRLQRRSSEVDEPAQPSHDRSVDPTVADAPTTRAGDAAARNPVPTESAAATTTPSDGARAPEGGRPADPSPDLPGSASEPGNTGAEPTVRRDDRTVDLRKGETDTVRVDRDVSPWAPTARPTVHYPPPPSGAPAGSAGGDRPVPPLPPSWGGQPAGQQPPSWSTPPAPPSWAATRPYGQSPAQQLPAHRPPGSPPLPAPRGRGIGPLLVFGVLAALVIAGGAWALISLAAGSSPFGPGTEDPRGGAPYTAAPAPSEPYRPAPSTEYPSPGVIPPSDGPSGQVVVNWNLLGVDYRATLTTTGSTGSAEVTYTDPAPGGALRTMRQDLTLASSDGRSAYVGSNPVDVDTGAPTADYAPDIFLLETTSQGTVYVVEVCDTTGTCAPATME